MSLTTNASIAEGFSFPVKDANGALIAATGLPTAVLKRVYTSAGVRTIDEAAAVVTVVAQPTAGLYFATWTNGAWTEGDQLQLYATAVVAAVPYTSLVAVFEVVLSGIGIAVNVLPATGIVADRSAGTTLLPVIGETISQAVTVYQSDGTTAVNLSGKTLAIIFETMNGADVAVVAAADITITGASSNIVTFAYPAAVTASVRTLRFAIRDAATPLTMYLQGVCSVVSAPVDDP